MHSASGHAYHQFAEAAGPLLLYSRPWWLDAVCGNKDWNAVVAYDENGLPQAALPYYSTRIRGISALITPPLTPWVSCLVLPELKSIMYPTLLHSLPKSSILDLSIRPDSDFVFQDDLFPVHLKYSFIIPRTPEPGAIRERYNEGLRRNLKQAEEKYTIQESQDIQGFLDLCINTFQQRKMKPPPWLARVIPEVYKEIIGHRCGSVMIASWNGKMIAGVMTAWDHESGYYVAGGRSDDDQGASAHALLLDRAIHVAQQKGLSFDFEGSMHPGIANFFQSFGSKPWPYWQIRKYRGLGKLWSVLR